jgi:hypothetical protein
MIEIFNTLLLDGSPCGINGFCSSGECKGALPLSDALLYLRDNPLLLAAVSILAAMILLSLLSCCYSRCAKKRKSSTPSTQRSAARLHPSMSGQQTYPHSAQSTISPSQGHWVDHTRYNGHIPYPPPSQQPK